MHNTSRNLKKSSLKMNNKYISVIMSTYNNEKSVGACIESITQQTFKNFEFLILDDGSTDNTYEIIQKKKLADDRIKIFRNDTNLGLTKSLNILINKTNAPLIARQDADDISTPQRFEQQIASIEKYDLDFCTTRAKIMKSNKVIPKLSFYLPKKIIINFKNPFVHGTLLIKKQSIYEIGLYDEDFYFSQDYKLFNDLLLNNYKFKILNLPLYELNTFDNISSKYSVQQKYYADCVRKGITP
jgi:glycosyltransferase involved in cell wall biosynthesis